MEKEKMMYEQFLNDKEYYVIFEDLISYDDYNKEIDNKLIGQITLREFRSYINDSDKKYILVNSLNNINKSVIYSSLVHGIDHNQRVAMYGFYLSLKNNLSDKDIGIVLDACMYHDIGRVNDYEDKSHGFRSALKLDFLDNLSLEELNILKCIITCHSIDDSCFDIVANNFNIVDKEKALIFLNILKDADALDRTRLGYYGLDSKYLRLEESKKMIILSYKVFNNYENIKYRVKK